VFTSEGIVEATTSWPNKRGTPEIQKWGAWIPHKGSPYYWSNCKAYVHVSETCSPPAIEKLLGGAPPTKTIQEAMETHKPFGSCVFVSPQPINGAPELMSTDTKHHLLPAMLKRVLVLHAQDYVVLWIAHKWNPCHQSNYTCTPYDDTFAKIRQGGNC
jgi:hypothetical protein